MLKESNILVVHGINPSLDEVVEGASVTQLPDQSYRVHAYYSVSGAPGEVSVDVDLPAVARSAKVDFRPDRQKIFYCRSEEFSLASAIEVPWPVTA